jgi:hypothetical protein
MPAGGRSQCRIPLERPCPCRCAGLIGQQDDLPCLRLNRVLALNLKRPGQSSLRQDHGHSQRQTQDRTKPRNAHNQFNPTLPPMSLYSCSAESIFQH